MKHQRLLVAAALVTAILLTSLFLFQDSANRPLHLNKDEEFSVTQGMGILELTSRVHNKGWIDSTLSLRLLAFWSRNEGRIKAGSYLLTKGITQRELLQLLREGRVRQHQVTFLEGWQFRQFRDTLASTNALVQRLPDMTDSEILSWLQIDEISPEGQFFPDTYSFTAGSEDLSILARSHRQMKQTLTSAWQHRAMNLPYTNPQEALILASIIEKETGLAADRDRIAAVFLNRLNRGMRLQSDPTIIFGMKDEFDGNIRKADLRHKNPYNTYLENGLPPGPICSPGLGSIRAALHPASTNSLYFVARGDGTSEFSETLDAHNAAVRRFQLKPRNQE